MGREPDLSWIEERLDRARSGQQGLVRVEGEPGVGKTALARGEPAGRERREDALAELADRLEGRSAQCDDR